MNDRLHELLQKEDLSTAELNELIQLSPRGTFMKLPNVTQMGVVDVQKSLTNLQEGPERSKHALNNGCYVEVIALRVQHAEYWLRMYWAAKNARGEIFGENDKRTFGMIIGDCKRLGFVEDLIEELQEFNKKRIDAVHKYLLGNTDYEALREACDLYFGLDSKVREFVISSIGVPVESADDFIGNVVLRRDVVVA